jgi:hypothetical protein
MLTGLEVEDAFLVSVATAVRLYVPAATFDQLTLYGLVVSVPIGVAPEKNCTWLTVPSASLAFADTVIAAPAANVAPALDSSATRSADVGGCAHRDGHGAEVDARSSYPSRCRQAVVPAPTFDRSRIRVVFGGGAPLAGTPPGDPVTVAGIGRDGDRRGSRELACRRTRRLTVGGGLGTAAAAARYIEPAPETAGLSARQTIHVSQDQS